MRFFARMKYSKSSSLVEKEEPAQTVGASEASVTENESTTHGDQSAQPSTLKPMPTTTKKQSKKYSKA